MCTYFTIFLLTGLIPVYQFGCISYKLYRNCDHDQLAYYEFLCSTGLSLLTEFNTFKAAYSVTMNIFPKKFIFFLNHFRLRAKKGPAPPPLGNFADISYLEENFKPHLLRDVCTLCSGALVSDSLLHMLL